MSLARAIAARRAARSGASAGVWLVVALVGVAAVAVGWPAVTRWRAAAAQPACLENLRQIARATLLYAQDHNEMLPIAWGSGGGEVWMTSLKPYLARSGAAGAGASDVFHCPWDFDGPSRASYATNALVAGAGATPHIDAERLSAIPSPQEVIWAGDTAKLWRRNEGHYDTITDWVRPEVDLGYPKTDVRAIRFYWRWIHERDWTDLHAAPLDCPDGLYQCKYPAFRHGRTGKRTGRANFVYLDGHASSVKWGTLSLHNLFPRMTAAQEAEAMSLK